MITVEEGSIGGFGSHVANFLLDNNLLSRNNFKFKSLFLPDYFIEHKSQNAQLAEAGLDANGISKVLLKLSEKTLNNKILAYE
jgi:1-deoxy-D-xylulose-5-phosphate synthase